MASHNRKRSRGSMSLLTRIRSISRAGPGAERIPDHPDHTAEQPFNTSQSLAEQDADAPRTGPASSSLQTAIATTTESAPTSQVAPKSFGTPFQTPPPSYETPRRERPRSWLVSLPRPLFRHKRFQSVQLPRKNTTTTRPIISAPVLTSTTNSRVAEAEGVRIGVITDESSFRRNMISPRPVEPIVKNPEVVSARLDKEDTDVPAKMALPALKRILQSLQGHGKKVKDVVSEKNESKDSTEGGRKMNLERGIARRKAETINLCRDKINRLTGHGTVKRKDLLSATPDLVAGSANTSSPTTSTPSENTQSFIDLYPTIPFDSLSRSFASAVDKLNFQDIEPSSCGGNMKFPKAKSFFSLKRRSEPKIEERSAENFADTNTHVRVNSKEDSKAERNARASEDSFDPDDYDAETVSLKTALIATRVTRPEPIEFNASTNRYVPAPGVPGYPRGVNPLAMHTDVMAFARPANAPTPQQMKGKEKEKEEEVENGELDAIEQAPIYSESSGDLRQYETTPASDQPIMNGPKAPETPTHKPVHHKGLFTKVGLRRSESGMGLFQRSKKENTAQEKPMMKKSRSMHFGLFKREEHDPMPTFVPVTPSPLRNIANISPAPVVSSSKHMENSEN